jgi:hypothetical protein
MRDKLAAERLDWAAKIKDFERIIAMEDAFRKRLRVAVRSEVDARRVALREQRTLGRKFQQTVPEIERSNRAFAGMSRERMEALLGARLIEREAYLTGNHQLSELALSNLGLSERSVYASQKEAELKRGMDAFSGIEVDQSAAGTAGANPTKADLESVATYETVQILHDLDRSVIDAARASDGIETARASIAALDETLARSDRLIKGLKDSPYVNAWEHNLTVAFVPYENLPNVMNSGAVYSCALGPIWCKKIGRIARVLNGEVVAKHPIRNVELRGVMVELEVAGESSAIQHTVLHAGRPPLFL